jgi:hypothetical protein
MRRAGVSVLAAAFLASLILSGSLGAPFRADEVSFDAVRREFDAIAVVREHLSSPSSAPIVLSVHLLGDGADADLTLAKRWLRENANVILVSDARGAPLYLTRLDLSATSGRATLGATIDSGMSAEVSNAAIGNCVVAHEALHFLGLKHREDTRNMMHPQCTKDRLAGAHLDADQKLQLAKLKAVVATTPRGVVTWASR